MKEPSGYVVASSRGSIYFLQGVNGWGQRSCADVYEKREQAEKIATRARKLGVGSNAVVEES